MKFFTLHLVVLLSKIHCKEGRMKKRNSFDHTIASHFSVKFITAIRFFSSCQRYINNDIMIERCFIHSASGRDELCITNYDPELE